MNELPIIQKTHDLIQWYVPILNRLPRDHKFLLGDRIVSGLYDLLGRAHKSSILQRKTVSASDLEYPARYSAPSNAAAAQFSAPVS